MIKESFRMALACTLLVFGNFVFVTKAFGQSDGDYRSAQSGNWNNVQTWQVYNANAWVLATTVPNSTNGAITIQNGHNVTLTDARSIDQTTVEFGGTITVNQGVDFTVVDGQGTDLIVNGTISNSETIFTTSSGSVVGTIHFKANSTYIHARNGGYIPTATWDIASTCKVTGYTNSQMDGLGQAFAILLGIVDKPGLFNMSTIFPVCQ